MTRRITLKYLILKTLLQVFLLTSAAYMILGVADIQGHTHFDFLVIPLP